MEVRQLVLPRGEALVPCAFGATEDERWERKISSCGAMVPHAPRSKCPECGNKMIGAFAMSPSDNATIIEDDTVIIDADTGKVVVIHVTVARQVASELLRSISSVYFDKQVLSNKTTTARLSGITVTHRTFGYSPPQVMRRRYGCSRSQFNRDYPEVIEHLSDFCSASESAFKEFAPEAHEETLDLVSEIAPAWRIRGTPWTSGIINKTAALPYHVDKDNVKGSWSAMILARRNVSGGLLHLAHYNVYLAVPHGSLTLFDGQSIVHGVTPMRVSGPNAQRFSCVVYAKRAMKRCCADPKDEIKRAMREATAAEDRRSVHRFTER